MRTVQIIQSKANRGSIKGCGIQLVKSHFSVNLRKLDKSVSAWLDATESKWENAFFFIIVIQISLSAAAEDCYENVFISGYLLSSVNIYRFFSAHRNQDCVITISESL